MEGRLHFSLSRGVTVASLVLLAVSISAFTSFSSNLLSLPSLGEPSKNLRLHNVGPPGVASLAKDKGKLKELISNLPLAFEANVGQVDQRVKFLSRGLASDLLLGSKEAMLRLRRSGTPFTFRFIGAKSDVQVKGVGQLAGHRNYFLGNDRSTWQTDVPLFRSVRYSDVYPGINLTYHGNHHDVEFDLEVAPGADPGGDPVARRRRRGPRSHRPGGPTALDLGHVRPRRPEAPTCPGARRRD